MSETPSAQDALQSFYKLQLDYIHKREEYRRTYASGWLISTQKTGDAKKYESDVATSALRQARDVAETLAACAWQKFLVIRGPLDNSTMPGGKFGSA